MLDRKALIDQLKRHEGSVTENGWHRIYYDSVGIATIGYGRNLEDKGLAEDEAEFLLGNDVDEAILDCQTLPFWNRLDPVRQQVLANMVFNIGFNRFLDFKNTIAAIERGDFKTAAEEMLDSKWARQVGPRAKELAEMMEGD